MTVAQQILLVIAVPKHFTADAATAICNHVKTMPKADVIELVRVTTGRTLTTKPKAIDWLRSQMETAIGA